MIRVRAILPSGRGRMVGLENGVVMLFYFILLQRSLRPAVRFGPGLVWLNLGGHHRVHR